MRLVATATAAAAAALCLCAAPASAQLPILSPADQKAILCIFDGFSADEKRDVALGEINGEEKYAAAETRAMIKGAVACKEALRGDQRRINLAKGVAIEEAIIDAAVSQLKEDGMKAGSGGIYDVWNALARKDQDFFLDDKAPDDLAFRARIKPLLVKAGVPDKETDIDGGLLIMECITNIAVYYRQWQEIDADTTR